MKIGFTGTRNGMTVQQGEAVEHLLYQLRPDEIHHGDCRGADAEFHGMAYRICGSRRVVHPPLNDLHRAFCEGEETKPAKSYHDRNHDIVDATDRLIATPLTDKESFQSGTWTTIRYARRLGKPVYIVTPYGKVITENVKTQAVINS